MQRILILILTLNLYIGVNAGVSTSITLTTAGTLKSQLTTLGKLTTTTDLTISGPIDAQDFKTMKSSMSALQVVDISATDIIEFIDISNVIGNGSSITYAASEVPIFAFSYNSKITSITLPTSANIIKDHAFYNCTALTQVTIPNAIASIGDYAFNKCPLLSSIFIPASVSTIGNLALGDCAAYITVDSNNSDYSSLNGILYNKDQTTLIQCPNSISGAISIASTTLTLESYAFNYCTSLTQITIPASVATIKDYAFRGCPALLVVENGNTNFSSLDGILYNADKTTLIQCPTSQSGTITIPSSVKTIGKQAFYDCKLISQIIFPNSVTTISANAFNNCTNLTIASLPTNLITLGASAFANCSKLTQAIIPSSVTVINSNVYSNCTSLTQVSIPASITTIGTQVFLNCTSLSSIYAYLEAPVSITSGVFSNVNKTTCTLHVPTGTTAAYEAADYWKDFTNIVEFDATPVETSDKTQFSIYPNPASSYFTVTTSQPSELVIIALSGVEVHKQFVYDNDRVDISHLKQGIYLVNLNNQCIKLVKRY